MFRVILVFCVLALSFSVTIAQKKEPCNPDKRREDFLTPQKTVPFMKTKEYLEARKRLERDFCWIYDSDEKENILSQSKETILKNLTLDKDFWKIAKARYWAVKNAPEVIPDLIEMVKNSAFVGLKGQADLIIWERIESGDLKFYGHGWVVADDLFRVAGRASWVLSESTGQRFGVVMPKSTPEELKQISDAWAKWYKEQGGK